MRNVNELDELTRNLNDIREAVALIRTLAQDREKWVTAVDDMGESLVYALGGASATLDRLESSIGSFGKSLVDESAVAGRRMDELRLVAETLDKELRKASDSLVQDKQISGALGTLATRLESLESSNVELRNAIDRLGASLEPLKTNITQMQKRQAAFESNVRNAVRDEVEKSARRIMGAVDALGDMLANLETAFHSRNGLSRLFRSGPRNESH